ncbi:glycoprotease family-domain-containing protein [Protomyces lactucae-debilis]|uniref:N(6)-L-threonylcarbamoyladenine synthase n=1 Tax=Protomyces lactucae-debilis TaxID=2754530 RepID=A0A1Y2FBT1_PROLT|nr:glycoprotease family-domain-containing protein [Protomyces lactucae-debilis]ORY80894.1 glycoprotease family-domain-containing protein [Protomyces lactucae-debilis]
MRRLAHYVLRASERCCLHTKVAQSFKTVLAIETSCDDTCLSILECDARPVSHRSRPKILHTTIARSLDQHEAYGGIHPIVAVRSHDAHMPCLVDEAKSFLQAHDRSVDLICVTKGPGMRSSLQVGIDAATGLSQELDVPLLGVHHMQAHALTPRLLHDGPAPAFPYISLLVSGGHTLLIRSLSIANHEILASTLDIAAGDMLDKVAKALKIPWQGSMPGAALERWLSGQEISAWQLSLPLHAKVNKGGKRYENMAFSFSGLGYSITKLLSKGSWTEEQRKALGGEAMRLTFHHLAAKVAASLTHQKQASWPTALVVSGGVARNQYLREILHETLARLAEREGAEPLQLIAPPLDLCSDNATMIAWAGFEMLQAGQATSSQSIVPRPKWPLDLLLSSDATFEEEMARRSRESIVVRRARQNLLAVN